MFLKLNKWLSCCCIIAEQNISSPLRSVLTYLHKACVVIAESDRTRRAKQCTFILTDGSNHFNYPKNDVTTCHTSNALTPSQTSLLLYCALFNRLYFIPWLYTISPTLCFDLDTNPWLSLSSHPSL